MEHPPTLLQRAGIVTARETSKRAMAGEIDVELPAAAVMLDRMLESSVHMVRMGGIG